MSSLVTKGHPALSAVSDTVQIHELPSLEIDHLLSTMWEAVRRHGGIGIAANQVAVTRRVIVINTKKTKLAVINPEIVHTWGALKPSHEGCLSFPGLSSRMSRYKKLRIKGRMKDGTVFNRTLVGLDAIVAQHEIDHLNGVTIDD